MDETQDGRTTHEIMSAEGWAAAEKDRKSGARWPDYYNDMIAETFPEHITSETDRRSYSSGYELYWSLFKGGLIR